MQEFINHGMLTMSPCVSTDQMGPSRFGPKGRLAFSMGGTGQDEGSAEAEYAWARGWKTAIVVKDNLLVYFRNVSDAFAKRFQELGGKIVDRQSFTSFKKDIGPVISKVAGEKADVISFVTAFGELPQFVGGIRSAGNNDADHQLVGRRRHLLEPEEPAGDRLLRRQLRVVVRRRPEPGRERAPEGAARGEAGSVHGQLRARRVRRSTRSRPPHPHVRLDAGTKLAQALEGFHGVRTISGPISYSKTLHSVVGRPWRIMKVQNNKESFVRMWTTKSVTKIH